MLTCHPRDMFANAILAFEGGQLKVIHFHSDTLLGVWYPFLLQLFHQQSLESFPFLLYLWDGGPW